MSAESDEEIEIVPETEEDPSEGSSSEEEDPSERSSSDDDEGPHEEGPIEGQPMAGDPYFDDPIEDQPEEADADDEAEPDQAPFDEFQQLIDEVMEDAGDMEDLADWEEEESEPDSEVDDPPYPVRSMTGPPPAPSSQCYQHIPGGLRWKQTARKSIPPIHPQDVFTFSMPRADGASTSAAGAAGPSAGVQPDMAEHVRRMDAQMHYTGRQLVDM